MIFDRFFLFYFDFSCIRVYLREVEGLEIECCSNGTAMYRGRVAISFTEDRSSFWPDPQNEVVLETSTSVTDRAQALHDECNFLFTGL